MISEEEETLEAGKRNDREGTNKLEPANEVKAEDKRKRRTQKTQKYFGQCSPVPLFPVFSW